MLKRLNNFFNNTKIDTPVHGLHAVATDSAEEEIDYSTSWQEIDQTFTGVLLGCNSLVCDKMSKFEKSIHASIHETFLKGRMSENLVPRLPDVVPKIMQALRSEETDASKLTNILSDDVVLVSEVIKLANSAYYGHTQTYKSLEQAVVNIGFNGIRQLIISVSMKPILNSSTSHFLKIASAHLWDKTMNACVLSDCAAEKMHEDRFNAYLSSMALQTGMAVLLREMNNRLNDKDVPRNEQFSKKLNAQALEISARISEKWQFPEAVTTAIREQVLYDDPEKMSKLGSITFISDKLAKMSLLTKNNHSYARKTDISQLVPASMVGFYSPCTDNLDIF